MDPRLSLLQSFTITTGNYICRERGAEKKSGFVVVNVIIYCYFQFILSQYCILFFILYYFMWQPVESGRCE